MHGGSIPGFKSHLAFVPALGIGMFLSSNSDDYRSFYDTFPFIMDIILENTPHKNATKSCQSVSIVREKEVLPHPGKQPLTKDIVVYVGLYGENAYGDIKVDFDNGNLTLKYGRVDGVYLLSHIGNDMFLGMGSELATQVNGPILASFLEHKNNKYQKLKLGELIFQRDLPTPDFTKLPIDAPQPCPPIDKTPSSSGFMLKGKILSIVILLVFCLA